MSRVQGRPFRATPRLEVTMPGHTGQTPSIRRFSTYYTTYVLRSSVLDTVNPAHGSLAAYESLEDKKLRRLTTRRPAVLTPSSPPAPPPAATSEG